MINRRISKAYFILGKTFGTWISPILTGVLIIFLRFVVIFSQFLDQVFFPSFNQKIINPIIIVGNPRSGTTFLHRFLITQKIGTGSQLWQLIYPSIFLQKLIKPILPLLEIISPTRHHSTKAHKTSLTSIETDDVSLLFRYLDGFFFYGFILTFDKEDLFHWVDPRIIDNSDRDYKWFDSIWRRNLYSNSGDRYIGKLFSLSSNLPKFQKKYPDASILYIVRDPLDLIPSGLSLVTGVLDKKFNFWSLDENIKKRFITRLYNSLVELLNRFQEDWVTNKINKEKVFIIRFDNMMNDFEPLMKDVMKFINIEKTLHLDEQIKIVDKSQKEYKSEHSYDLSKFELTEDKIKKDCSLFYKTFF